MISRNIKKILCIRPDMIGDVILITPALLLLRKNFPQAQIDIWAQAYTKPLLENLPEIDNVLVNPSLDFIRSQKYDMSIDFFGELPYALACFRAGIPLRLGDKEKIPSRFFYNKAVSLKMNDLTKHKVEHNIDLLKDILSINYQSPLKLEVSKKGQIFLSNFLKQQQIKENDLVIGIHLGTGKGNKAWLPERFAETIDYLTEKLKAKVVITGSKKEKLAADTVIEKCCFKPINLVEKTSLEELIGIFSRLNVYIGVDTGPMHLAAALKRSIVALFPSKFVKPTQWGPWHTQHIIIRKKIHCAKKCLPKDCLLDDCLKEITVKDIVTSVENILQNKANNTIEEAKKDWFKKSANILTNSEAIQKELSKDGYFSYLLKSIPSLKEMINLIIKEDINIIHWIGKIPLKLNIARIISALSNLFPALLISNKNVEPETKPIVTYLKAFSERNHL